MKDIVKVKRKKLSKTDIPGSFLYKETLEKKDKVKMNYYFSRKFEHILFETTVERKDKNGDGVFFGYVADLMNLAIEMPTELNFALVNCGQATKHLDAHFSGKYQFVEPDVSLLGSGNVLVCEKDAKDFIESIINEKNTNTNLFVVLNRPEDLNLENLDKYVTVAQSRRIYFVINIEDTQKFVSNYSPENLGILQNLCGVNFKVEDNKIVACNKTIL